MRALSFSLLILLTAAAPHRAAAELKAVHLKTEYRVNPLGLDTVHPRLFWQVTSQQRGARQTGYRILVASTPQSLADNTGDLWDTGKVSSPATIQIPYDGTPLTSRMTCFWKVCVWDADGLTTWSEPAQWSMGLLQEEDWQADYISYRDDAPVWNDPQTLHLPAPRQYRTSFEARPEIQRATLYATALGIYEVEINGRRVSDAYFAPGWSDYRQRAYYNTYDVTHSVQQGRNAIGAVVADGWYSGYLGFGLLTGIGTEKTGRSTYGKTPALRAQLEIEYTDGTRETIGTSAAWKVTGNGPIREADLLMGEVYDARQELPGWSTATYDDADWETAIAAQDNAPSSATFFQYRNPQPGQPPKIEGEPRDLSFRQPRLEAFPGLPVRATARLVPISVTRHADNAWIFNLGQNFAGTIRLQVKGPAGQKIKIRYGEMLHPDGRLMTENLRRARATDTYICKGDPDGEQFSPRFTFHGFQYVEVTGLTEEPTADSLTGLPLHSDTPLVSTFACSDPMVNQLFSNVVWTQRANFIDLPTDCPQRDERMGWTGDAQAYVATAAYNADISAFFTKWNRELMESQRPSGAFPGYAPFPFQHGWDFGTAWADAGIICPWTIWQVYGDTRMIDESWEPMTRFLQWRIKTSQEDLGIAHGNNWGDWLAQGAATPLEFVDTVYFALSTSMMADMAAATGRQAAATQYRQQFADTKAAFGRRYVQPDGRLSVNTQTACALALYTGLIPEAQQARIGEQLSQLIADNGNHMATGFLGTRVLLPALTAAGQHDLAVFLLQSHEFPSWGYEIDQGATSIWERWDSFTRDDGFGRHNAAMNSFAHYAFGAVCEWMFRTLAGIDSGGVAYESIVIRPSPPRPGSNGQHTPISWVKASYDSIRGPIRSQWRVEDADFHLQVEIPANTTATVYLPATAATAIKESGTPLDQVDGVEVVHCDGGIACLKIVSGQFDFSSTGSITPAATPLVTSEKTSADADAP